MAFTMCSFNYGSRIDDYATLYTKDNPNFNMNHLSDQEWADFQSRYQLVQKTTTEKLLATGAQVFCLQEVSCVWGENEPIDDREIIKQLRQRNFEIVRAGNGPAQKGSQYLTSDTVVAFSRDYFTLIKDLSTSIKITAQNVFFKDVAIAHIQSKLNDKSYLFVSGHAPGFPFSQIGLTAFDTTAGDSYCGQVANRLEVLAGSVFPDHIILGIDMNAHPDRVGHQRRFECFRAKQFDLVRPGFCTNLNVKDEMDRLREIDFIMARSIQSLQLRIADEKCKSFEHDPKSHCSDHLPIFLDILDAKSEVKKVVRRGHAPSPSPAPNVPYDGFQLGNSRTYAPARYPSAGFSQIPTRPSPVFFPNKQFKRTTQ